MLNARAGGGEEFGGTRPTTKFNELVRSALDQNDNDIHGAARTLLEWSNIDPSVSEMIWNELVPRLLLQCCRDEIRDQRTRIAESYVKERFTKDHSTPPQEETSKRLSAGRKAMFMNWPLPDGRRLKDVRGEELNEVISMYDRQAKEMSRRARWLRLIAQRVQGQTVGEAMEEQDLQELWSEC